MNILDNAIKYTQKGGIDIKLQIVNGRLQIVVADTGEGLTKEEISRLFESFSRGTAGAKFWAEGVGLGLYVSRKFVELHGGKIWAESEGKGKGSTFYIELPMK
jgi:signal transduction histidine kinase